MDRPQVLSLGLTSSTHGLWCAVCHTWCCPASKIAWGNEWSRFDFFVLSKELMYNACRN